MFLKIKEKYLINSLTDFFIIIINYILRKYLKIDNFILTSLNRRKKKIIQYYSQLVNYEVQNG